MSRKRKDEIVMGFVQTVYPEYTDLSVAVFDELQCLSDAIELIESLRKDRNELLQSLKAARDNLSEIGYRSTSHFHACVLGSKTMKNIDNVLGKYNE